MRPGLLSLASPCGLIRNQALDLHDPAGSLLEPVHLSCRARKECHPVRRRWRFPRRCRSRSCQSERARAGPSAPPSRRPRRGCRRERGPTRGRERVQRSRRQSGSLHRTHYRASMMLPAEMPKKGFPARCRRRRKPVIPFSSSTRMPSSTSPPLTNTRSEASITAFAFSASPRLRTGGRASPHPLPLSGEVR